MNMSNDLVLFTIKLINVLLQTEFGASVAEWLRSLTSNLLPITAVGSNPDRDFGFFNVRKLSS
jgi:hypothetical protein